MSEERDDQREERRARERAWSALMCAAQDGDAEAYDRLLRELLGPLRAYAMSRLGDSTIVDDVVQNVLLSIHRARHTYRPERPFAPWLWTIARNAVADSFRARGLRMRREQPLDTLEGSEEPSVEPAPRLPLSTALRAALDGLPPAQRQAVELLHLNQLSVAEAAEHAGVTPGALKVRAHRGYKALRVALEDEDL